MENNQPPQGSSQPPQQPPPVPSQAVPQQPQPNAQMMPPRPVNQMGPVQHMPPPQQQPPQQQQMPPPPQAQPPQSSHVSAAPSPIIAQQMPPPSANSAPSPLTNTRLMGPPPPPGQRPMYGTPVGSLPPNTGMPVGGSAPTGYMSSGPNGPVVSGQMASGPQANRPISQMQAQQQQNAQPIHPDQRYQIGQMAMQQSGRMPPPPSPAFTGSPQQMNRSMVTPLPNTGTPTAAGSLKRPAPMASISQTSNKQHATPVSQMPTAAGVQVTKSNKKKKLADKILPQKVRDLVPESQAYMDLLAFERKLDFTITRKRLDIQEALKRPMKQKRKLRIFISNTFYPGKPQHDTEQNDANSLADSSSVPSWELRVEGRLLEDQNGKPEQSKYKRKFSSFFKSLVIELDKDLYGPDNHLVEWHRSPNTTETDGFQVKRPGDKNVKCTILLLLDHQPMQFKLDQRLARLMGIHTQTRPMIINALWQYIKTHKLQDSHEREFINCDKYLEQIFNCQRMRFGEIPVRLNHLLSPADPIVINHVICVENGTEILKRTACYDIEVEIDDVLKQQMSNFVLSTGNQQEIQNLDNKIHETVDTINELKTNREFLLSFANDPQSFIQKWLISQMRDLKLITDQVGNPEEERKSDFFYQAWTQEAVCRYFYGKVQQKRAELEQALGIRNS